MIRAVVFDIDNTLTDDVSWLRLTELMGAPVPEHQRIFAAFLAGELSYEAATQHLTELWRSTGKARKAYWRQLFADWPLKPQAAELVQAAAAKGYELALITGSLDVFAEAIAARLGVSHWYANAASFWDEAGELRGFTYVKDQSAEKVRQLQQFTDSIGVTSPECLVIGDGDNDLGLFKATGRGIAVGNGSPDLSTAAWKQAASLADAMEIVRGL